jgi:hypothetical protein
MHVTTNADLDGELVNADRPVVVDFGARGAPTAEHSPR